MSDTVEKSRVKYEHLRSHMDEKVLSSMGGGRSAVVSRGVYYPGSGHFIIKNDDSGMSELESGGPGVES